MTDNDTKTTNLFGFFEAMDMVTEALEISGHHLYLKFHTLNHPIFSHEKFIETLKTKLVKSQRFHCHILVEEMKPSKSNSEFIRLYKRLTDYIEIRHFKPEHTNADRRQYVIVDNNLLAWQSYDMRHDMRVFEGTHRIKDFADSFDTEWRNSSRDLGLLKLYI